MASFPRTLRICSRPCQYRVERDFAMHPKPTEQSSGKLLYPALIAADPVPIEKANF
jgi:hypothetical protein